jgi:hypothetical protein
LETQEGECCPACVANFEQCSDEWLASFEKYCANDGQCGIGLRQVDCCGSMVAVGITDYDLARFKEEEAKCAQRFPGCECAPRPTTAEDGKAGEENAIKVRCLESGCRTYVP